MQMAVYDAFVKSVSKSQDGQKQYLEIDCPNPNGRSYDVSLQTSSLQVDWSKLETRSKVNFVARVRPFTWKDKKTGAPRVAFDCSHFELAK